MFKALTPLLAIAIAIGLVLTHIQPSFIAIRNMERETDQYENALKQADELRRRIEDKLNQRRNFDQTSLVRLSQLLPTKTDEIGIILSLDTLAKEHDMTFSSIEVTKPDVSSFEEDSDMDAVPEEDDFDSVDPVEPVDPGEPLEDIEPEPAGTVAHTDISFTVSGTYDQFKSFMTDVERSLTLFEVIDLKFGEEAAESGDINYELTLRTFSHTTMAQ